jgi:hypothetical protein
MRTASRLTTPARPVAAALAALAAPVLIVPVLMLPVLAAGSALAAPSAGPPPASNAPAITGPAGSAAGSQRERFTLVSYQADSRRERLRAAGVLRAHGVARIRLVTPSRTVTRLVFAHGAVRLVTYPEHRSVSVPSPSCSFTEVIHGDYAIRGGDRRYRNATGAGAFITKIIGHLKKVRGGGCGAQLTRFWQRTRTWGTLRW